MTEANMQVASFIFGYQIFRLMNREIVVVIAGCYGRTEAELCSMFSVVLRWLMSSADDERATQVGVSRNSFVD